MPKRTRKSAAGSPRAVLLLAAATLALLALGEGLLLARTDSGQILMARVFGWGDRAQLVRLIGADVRKGLTAVGVPRDSVHESVSTHHKARVRWHVGLSPGTSLLQVNYAISKCLADRGAEVLSAREHPGSDGASLVTMVAGLAGRPTHEITLVRWRERDHDTAPRARLALVLYGFAEDQEDASGFFALPVPFAVALTPGAAFSEGLFQKAREKGREVVLHLPLEPINFPQVNPGPGTILVTMKPLKIAGLVRRYLEDAGPVSAVANHMGSLATQDMTVMRAVYQELRRRHLPFLHVAPAAGAVCKPLAADLGVAYDQPDAVIDAEARGDRPRALDRRWNEVLQETRRRGQMVVMMRATPLTRSWLPKALASRRLAEVSLVPLESVLRKPAAL